MENYKYMIDTMNKINEEYFKVNTPSIELDGYKKTMMNCWKNTMN